MKRLFSILIIVSILSLSGCIFKNNVNEELITEQFGLYVSFSPKPNPVILPFSNTSYMIIPTLIFQNNTLLEIEKVVINEKTSSFSITLTEYGYGINITPIPYEFEVMFKERIIQKFDREGLNINERFYADGPGLSFWNESDNNKKTMIYSSENYNDGVGFELLRYSYHYGEQPQDIRDYGSLTSLKKGWNEIILQRDASVYRDYD